VTQAPKAIRLEDYTAPDFLIKTVSLCFWLDENRTRVSNTMTMTKQNLKAEFIELNGEELEFESVKIDGETLTASQYELMPEGLKVFTQKTNFELEVTNFINPVANKALDGLYKSGTILCTQNEPEGFRRITYFLDRPDVMAVFTTKMIADKKTFPLLLSNGNKIESGDLPDGKHFATWLDPFAKPCYLYALVAGDLGVVEDKFITRSGREILLQVFCDKGNEDKCHHAMVSLQKSMKWDEERFGLEYDLDIYMIVAVDSFNMGAMENKGLNIFNSAYVLAKPETATDDNFLGIESVIGHEYFHNWTGNRITCRDWFQLTLKEGLTVYRDQEFSSDLNSRAVERVQSVQGLRAHQFNEDAGPLAHPIKPKTYLEINNFYSSTVYEKGSEVIRMMATMLGTEGFRRGMDKYFELFDGQAVTTEDFVHALSIANGNYDFSQFSLWYDQAGTPEVHVEFQQDQALGEVRLLISQKCPPTPGQAEKKPFHMPFLIALLDEQGHELPLKLKNDQGQPDLKRGLLHLKKTEEEFVFTGLKSKVTPSLNREFSSPIKLTTNLTQNQMIFLMARDTDAFNRYEMAQELYTAELEKWIEAISKGATPSLNPELKAAFASIIKDEKLDPMMKSLMLTLPGESSLHQRQKTFLIDETAKARHQLVTNLATEFAADLKSLYANHQSSEYALDPLSIGKRALKNRALGFLSTLALKDNGARELLVAQFKNATNMTDEITSLTLIHHSKLPESADCLKSFYQKWKHETLVMQKWFGVQTSLNDASVFKALEDLQKLPEFDLNVPNLVRSLFGPFMGNAVQFHEAKGAGYRLMSAKLLEVDRINPQMAARLASAFKVFAKMDEGRKTLMKTELTSLLKTEGLSKNTYEVISKILG